jgi:hypothetical protein
MTDVIIAAHDAVPPREPISQQVEPGLNRPIQTETAGQRRADYLPRRLDVVWLDLGLDSIVPAGWAAATPNGLSFGELNTRQADNLIRALEDIAACYEREVPTPGPNQLSLFEDVQ